MLIEGNNVGQSAEYFSYQKSYTLVIVKHHGRESVDASGQFRESWLGCFHELTAVSTAKAYRVT
jgi:hypothetical protein